MQHLCISYIFNMNRTSTACSQRYGMFAKKVDQGAIALSLALDFV